jgi:hypothetical protein
MADKNHSWLDAAIADAQAEIFGFDRAKASHLMRELLNGAMPAAQWIAEHFTTLSRERARRLGARQGLTSQLERLHADAPEAHLRQEKLRKDLLALDKALDEFNRQATFETMHYFKVVPGVLTMLMDIADRLDLLRAQEAGTQSIEARAVSVADLAGLLSPQQLAQVHAWIDQSVEER